MADAFSKIIKRFEHFFTVISFIVEAAGLLVSVIQLTLLILDHIDKNKNHR